jgi:hypothetical protein
MANPAVLVAVRDFIKWHRDLGPAATQLGFRLADPGPSDE